MAQRFSVDTDGTLTTNLISYYKLENSNDSFGSNNMTNVSSVTFGTGKVSNCANNFNGVTARWLTYATPLTSSVEFSCASWINLATTSSHGTVFSMGTSGGWGIGVGGTEFGTAGNKLFGLAGGVAWKNFNVDIGIGWHHIVLTKDSTTWKGYIDAVVCPTTFGGTIIAPTGNSTIGANVVTFLPQYRLFDGKIDELGVWSKALTLQEITDLYNGGNGQTMIDTSITSNGFRKLML